MNTIVNIFDKILTFDNYNIEFIIDKSNEIWFKFITIANILGYKSRKDALRLVDKEYKKLVKNILYYKRPNEHPNTVYISESGLYLLLLKSKMKIAIEFQKWLITIALPNIRKYGKLELDKFIKTKIKNLNKKIKLLEQSNKILKSNMQTNKFPTGTYIYILEDEGLYKIGYTNNLTKRLHNYNIGKANKLSYSYYKKTNCGKEIELCLKVMLKRYLYKQRKEFYNCKLDIIINKISKCLKIEKTCKQCSEILNNQNGGNIINSLIDLYNKKLKHYTIY